MLHLFLLFSLKFLERFNQRGVPGRGEQQLLELSSRRGAAVPFFNMLTLVQLLRREMCPAVWALAWGALAVVVIHRNTVNRFYSKKVSIAKFGIVGKVKLS